MANLLAKKAKTALFLEFPLLDQILACLDAHTLLSLRPACSALCVRSDGVARGILKDSLRYDDWKTLAEVWTTLLKLHSSDPRREFPLLFLAVGNLVSLVQFDIERDALPMLKRVLKHLARKIIRSEIALNSPNGLVKFSFVSLSGTATDAIRNKSLRREISRSLINLRSIPLNGATPFYAVCAQGRREMFVYMRGLGADANAMDKTGCTCLHALVRLGEGTAVREALEMGANCAVTDGQGETPLMLACGLKLNEIALMLIEVNVHYPESRHRELRSQTRQRTRRHFRFPASRACPRWRNG